MKNKILITLLLLNCCWMVLRGQQDSRNYEVDNIANNLVAHGFQNIQVAAEDSTLFLAYENRLYRFEANAIVQLLNIIATEVSTSFSQCTIIVLKEGIPQVALTVALQDFKLVKKQQMELAEFKQRIQITNEIPSMDRFAEPAKNTGTFKLEIVITPQLKLALGGFPDPVLHQVNINTGLNVYLWKGAKIYAEGIIPLANEIRIADENYVRPNIFTFQQQIRLPHTVFLKASAGYFQNNRYGGLVEAKKFLLNGNLLLEAKVGYTGYAAFRQYAESSGTVRHWEYAPANYLDYAVGAKYWLSKWNVRMGVAYGKALHHKKYLRVELTQRFKETEIGFFAFNSKRGNNYGVRLAIPIFSKKYWKPKAASIRPATHFNYTYHTTQNYVQSYETGLDNFENRLNPALLKNQLIRLLQD